MTTLTAKYRQKVVVSGAWLRLEPEPEEPANITRAELAQAIDSIHGVIDHCSDTTTADPYQLPVDGTKPQDAQQEYLQQHIAEPANYDSLVDAFGLGDTCNMIAGADIDDVVFVHYSSQYVADNYKLVSPTAKFSQKQIISTTILLRLNMSNIPQWDTEYFIEPTFDPENLIYEWIGNVVIDGVRQVGPPVGLSGSILHWGGGLLSGILEVELPIIYHKWAVTISSVLGLDGFDYACQITGIWDGAPVTLELELDSPDDDNDLCNGYGTDQDDDVVFPGDVIVDPDTGEIEPVEPEPEPEPEPEDCADDCDNCNAEDYERLCCVEPDGALWPPCEMIESEYGGGAPIAHGVEYWLAKYAPRAVSIVPVAPDDGCGTRIDTFVEPSAACCDEVTPVEYDYDNSADVIAPSSFEEVLWLYGQGEFVVSLSGSGFWLNSGHTVTTATTANRKITIYTDADACGTCSITITGACGETTGGIRCTFGVWVHQATTVDKICGNADSHTGTVHELIRGGVKTTQIWPLYATSYTSADGSTCYVTPCDSAAVGIVEPECVRDRALWPTEFKCPGYDSAYINYLDCTTSTTNAYSTASGLVAVYKWECP